MLIEQILVNGITGFNMPKDTSIHNISDIELMLKQLCYPYIGNGEIKTPHETANYFQIPFKNININTKFDLLIHQHLWYFTCIEANGTWGNLQFIEPDLDLVQQVKNINNNYTFLSEKLLNTKVEQSKLTTLNKYELNEIKYWKPKKYGQIIFNVFD